MDSPLLEATGIACDVEGSAMLGPLDLRVAAGEVLAVLGGNGAGKSTLLAALAGELPHRGELRVGTSDLTGQGLVGRCRAGVCLVPATRRLFTGMAVEENLAVGAYPRRPEPYALERVHRLFPRLAERRHQKAGTLSGGEQQMLAIGRALMARPAVLLVDEPSTGLSPLMAEATFDALAGLASSEGVAVVIAEQQVTDVLEVADRGVLLADGQVVLEGDAGSLRDDPRVARTYLWGA